MTQTRRRILEAATQEFIEAGYAATSVASIAAAAGVARETVYHLVGGKPQVLKAVYDVCVVGDHEEVPVANRDVYRAMLADPDPLSAARTFGRLSAELVGRIGPILRVLADADHVGELAQLLAETRAERLSGSRDLLATLSAADPAAPQFAHAVDVVYALLSPEVALVLLEQRGWSLEAYGDWLGQQVAGQVEQLRHRS